jgi:geranylgeranyl pyrophosphate synthase
MLDGLKAEIEKAIRQHCDEPPLRDAVLSTLRRPGFALHQDARCRAGGLTLGAYMAIRGGLSEPAWHAAAATELYIEAGFLFDNVADDDIDESLGTSISEEITLAITLMNCGVAAVSEAVRLAGLGPSSSHRVLRHLLNSCVSACAGQLLDARLEREVDVTSDEALRMTALKAGSCGRLAATVGASIATDDDELTAVFGELGSNLFIYLQLIDDVRDAFPAEGVSRDLLQRKKTLPLLYFYNWLSADGEDTAGGIMPAEFGAESRETLAPAFDATGAGVFGAVVAEAHLNQAKANLADLSKRLGPLEHLERYIDGIELIPHEALAAS